MPHDNEDHATICKDCSNIQVVSNLKLNRIIMIVFGLGISGFFLYLLNADQRIQQNIDEYKISHGSSRDQLVEKISDGELSQLKLVDEINISLAALDTATQLTSQAVTYNSKSLDRIEKIIMRTSTLALYEASDEL